MGSFDQFAGAGAGPIPQGNSTGLVAYPNETFQTPVLDLTQVQLGIELVPAKPGHVFTVLFINWVITQASGTQTTPLTMQIGNDAAHTNICASQSIHPSNAEVAAAVPPAVCSASSLALSTKLFPNAPTFLDITAGAQGTGGFSLKGYFIITTIWMAVTQ